MIPTAEMSSCWFALLVPAVPHPSAVPEVRAFRTEKERNEWVGQDPLRRTAVGKRNHHVRAFRTRMDQEERQGRAREREREAAYTTWMWESP